MNFSEALNHLKSGGAVARKGWQEQGNFVYLVPPAAYLAQTGVAKKYFGEGTRIPYAGYLAMKNPDLIIDVWTPSTREILAEDWYLVEISK